MVEECSHERSAAQQEEAQRIITGLSSSRPPVFLQRLPVAEPWKPEGKATEVGLQAAELGREGWKVDLEGQIEPMQHMLSFDSSASLVILPRAPFLPFLSMFTS